VHVLENYSKSQFVPVIFEPPCTFHYEDKTQEDKEEKDIEHAWEMISAFSLSITSSSDNATKMIHASTPQKSQNTFKKILQVWLPSLPAFKQGPVVASFFSGKNFLRLHKGRGDYWLAQ
jgi:hypothetical protein